MLSIQQSNAVKTAETLLISAKKTGGRKAMVIEATAGSGKTHTCREIIFSLLRMNPDLKIGYFVFGKSNQEEAVKKINDSRVTVKTFHAAGFGAFAKALGKKYIKVNNLKIYDIMRECRVPYNLTGIVKALVENAQNRMFNLTTTDDKYYAIIEHFGLESLLLDDDSRDNLSQLLAKAVTAAKAVLKASIAAAYAADLNFPDQIYMAALDKTCLASNDDKFDVVIIDEAQDSSQGRQELSDKMLRDNGLLVAVGDPYQAIMGFAGADNDSLDQIRSRFDAVTLPLSITYRCPRAVVEFVNQLIPDAPITAAETAKEGSVISGSTDLIWQHVDNESAILCRYNKPLVDWAFRLLSKGIACQILGKNIAKGLITLSRKWKTVSNIDQLSEKLESWSSKRIADLIAAGKDEAADTLNDQVECLQFMISQMPADSSLDSLKTKIDGMFLDENGELKPVVTLMSCHKSKGREFPKVFWLGRQKYQPSKYAKKQWQKEQERNLIFVAATRAIDTLYDIAV